MKRARVPLLLVAIAATGAACGDPRTDVATVTSSIAQAQSDTVALGTGRTGPGTITAANTVVNAYAPLASDVAAGAMAVTLSSGANQFGSMDLVLLVQTTGLTPIPSSGTPGPFDPFPSGVGGYEFARVLSRSGSTLNLTAPLVRAFPAAFTQVVRVPEYTTLTINTGASITSTAWNGATGGIVAFLATGAVTNNGDIAVNAQGFRGGTADQDVTADGCSGLDEPEPNAGEKGEGLVPSRFGSTQTGYGNVANGAGGGVCHNSGGGGGGNGGAGGNGGMTWSGDLGGSRDVGGRGGGAISGALSAPIVLLGGGGGAGHGNNGQASSGANGGGIIFIRGGSLLGAAGRLLANGGTAASGTNDGMGGGGAGGTIIARFNGPATCASASANGGNGGNATYATPHGPGGGGGGGRVLVQGTTVVCTRTSNPGSPGTTTGGITNGGLAGASGPGGTLPTEPSTTIVTAPASPTASTTASFTFTSDDLSSLYECRLDGAASFTACSASTTYMGLANGSHTLEVRARNPLGNADATPATHTWAIDLVPPDTTITSTPTNPTDNTSSSFQFTSEPGASFECAIDMGAFTSCTSPFSTGSLALGTHTFRVRAIDSVGNVDPSPASFTWRINATPAAVNDPATTAEDTSVDINVLANDTGLGDTPVTVSVVTMPTNGAAVVIAGNLVRYTPNANFNGSDAFTYRVTDNDLQTSTATVVVNITPVNDVPSAVNDSVTTNEDTAVTINELANDTGLGDAPLTVTITTAPTRGTAVVQMNGSIVYTPSANVNGADTFVYRVVDGNGDAASATVNITITPVNDVPVAVNDSATTNEDTAVSVNVLANDLGLGDAPLTVSVVTMPSRGTAVVQAGNTILYTPTANLFGADSFTYLVRDANNETSTATVSITVNSVDDIPDANQDSATTSEDTAVDITVLTNDTGLGDTPVTVTIVTMPSNGTAVVLAGNVVRYTPAANFFGMDAFSYRVTDLDGDVDTATVNVTISGVDDQPVAVNDSGSMAEDGAAQNFNVLGNDSGLGDAPVAVTITGGPSSGTASVNADNTIRFAPAADFNGTVTIDYRVTDLDGDSATARLTITVTPVDDVPMANADVASQPANSTRNINVLANDVGLGDAPITVTITSAPSTGTATVNADNTIRYVSGNTPGMTSLTYQVRDANMQMSSATLTITITNMNTTPVANADSAMTAEDAAVNIGVLANDTGLGDVPITVSVVTQPANGTAAVNADSTIRYIPAADFSGTNTIRYRVTDGDGQFSEADVTVTVTPVNDTPASANDAASTNEDTAVTVNVLANDSGLGDAPVVVTITVNPTRGSAVVLADNSVRYTPNANVNGTDVLTYQVRDVDNQTSTATLTITIVPVDDVPNAVNDAFTVAEDAQVSGNVLANDTGLGDTPLMLSITVMPANGSVTTDAAGNITYRPNANFAGSDAFTYLVRDVDGQSSSGTVSITVTPIDDVPSAVNDSATVMEDGQVDVNVLANDTGLGDAPVSVDIVGTTGGTATVNMDNSVRFVAAPDRIAPASVTYRVTDVDGQSSTATVAITITPVNDVPLAVDDTATVSEDTPASIAVLANDSGLGDAPVVVTVVMAPARGTATVNADNTIRYAPPLNGAGSDAFTYRVTDIDGQQATAQVTVSITPVDDVPVAVDDALTLAEDESGSVVVLANDTGLGDAPLVVTIAMQGARGTAVVNADNSITYTASPDQVGSDVVRYTVRDVDGETASAAIAVTITPVNDTPVALDDTATTDEDVPVDAVVLANDSGLGDQPVSVVIAAQGTRGTAVVNADNSITYTPSPNALGTDVVRYRVTDADGQQATADLRITIAPINDTPSAQPDMATLAEDSSTTIAVLANDTGLGDAPLAVTIVTPPSSGTVRVNADLTITFTPAPDANGADSFTYEVADLDGERAMAMVSLTVNPVQDAPVAADDLATVNENAVVTIDVLANDRDPDMDTLTVTIDTPPSSGNAVVNADNTIAFTAPGTPGRITFTYAVSDGAGGQDIATVTVNVGVDSDMDGLTDVQETAIGTDPNDPDTDDDGINDGTEVDITLTSPLRDDTDNDGILDGTEDLDHDGIVDTAETGALLADTDGDGIADGVERGLVAPEGQDTDLTIFAPDADPSTITDPTHRDSDRDGLEDGAEDVDHDGRADPRESDAADADTDDDGLLDGDEPSPLLDSDGDGLVNARDPDSDNDRLLDGTERSVTAAGSATNVAVGRFIADADPSTSTDPLDPDTDDGTAWDGTEDINHNGRIDLDERNPNDPSDDLPNPDTDGDGLPDNEELLVGTDPADPDTDDDGVLDGSEPNAILDTDRDGIINALDPDSDNDGLADGTELGIATPPSGTDVSRGFFIPDADPSTKTSPLMSDSDGGGASDGAEDTNHNGRIDAGETNPNDPSDDRAVLDADDDGLSDAEELLAGTDPNDADSDDDGVLDGAEPNALGDTDGDGLINALDADSDNDRITDGTELGLVTAGAATDVTRGNFRPDADPSTRTSAVLADTDGGGVSDGAEDADHNGRVDGGERNPLDPADDAQTTDRDGDGLSDEEEAMLGTDPDDADTDDDGVRDGAEANASLDSDRDGIINALDADSDNDGLSDGTELGIASPDADTDVSLGRFMPDADPSTRTSPLVGDSDGGGVVDGAEDFNRNGRIDAGELDPNDPSDDAQFMDADDDGLADAEEVRIGTRVNDADSDDDGVLDGQELDYDRDTDGDGRINALDPDSDGDGLRDGTELGIRTASPATDITAGNFIPDADPTTTTSPIKRDTDNGGVADGDEDFDKNGRIDGTDEGDPNDPSDDARLRDRDGDGLTNDEEIALGTDPRIADTDGDGLSDGQEVSRGAPTAYEPGVDTNPLDPDTDHGGVSDGTEVTNATDPLDPSDDGGEESDLDHDGLTQAQERVLGTNPNRWDTDGDGLSDGAEVMRGTPGIFDPGIDTNPTDADTDDGGVNDGDEARRGTDPLDPLDDGPVIDDDPDHDGLTNAEEARLGTNPNLRDTDGDGLADGTEVVKGTRAVFDPGIDTSPTDADTDGGSVGDGVEVGRGTNPLDPSDDVDAPVDTDGDGLTDTVERTLGTNPNLWDTDGDGLSDGQELRGGDPNARDAGIDTDPLDADTDDGGVSDGAEVGRGTNPLDPSDDGAPGQDPDGDGLTNAEEIALGTNPNRWDTDGDGLSDGQELARGDRVVKDAGDTDPLDADSDDGGVGDGVEVNRGTNPLDPSDDNPGSGSSSSSMAGSGSSASGASSSGSGASSSSATSGSGSSSSSSGGTGVSSSGEVTQVSSGVARPVDADGDGFPDDAVVTGGCQGCSAGGSVDVTLVALAVAGARTLRWSRRRNARHQDVCRT